MFDSRLAIVAISTGTTAVTGATFAPEHLAFVAIFVAGVGVIAGLMAWLDARMEKHILSHALTDVERHKAVLAEISHLRELLALQRGTPIQLTREASE